MKKEYILDDGKIRNCSSNIAKMNVLEYWWFDIVHKKGLWYAISGTLEQYGVAFKEFFFALVNTLFIIIFPITFLIKAYKIVKEAKREVAEHKQRYKRQ